MPDNILDSPWISVLFFCPLEDSNEGLQGASRSHGIAISTSPGPYWPMPEGEPLPNLGTILVVDNVPTTVDLGIFFVVYGTGCVNIQFSLSGDKTEEASSDIYHYETQISLGPPLHSDGPGIGAKRVRLHRCPLWSTGRYYLTASINAGNSMKLPLYVHLRHEWEQLENERLHQARTHLEPNR
jgi:hypothetical protein